MRTTISSTATTAISVASQNVHKVEEQDPDHHESHNVLAQATKLDCRQTRVVWFCLKAIVNEHKGTDNEVRREIKQQAVESSELQDASSHPNKNGGQCPYFTKSSHVQGEHSWIFGIVELLSYWPTVYLN